MINDVVLEGIVLKAWMYAEDLLFRTAFFRDPDLPSKSSSDSQDSADFVTIRVIKGNLSAPVTVEKGVHVRVHGFLQSRDYEESLVNFLKDARGGDLPVPDTMNPSDLGAPRGTSEMIARRIMNQRNGGKK
jgi:hypothetical protein